MNSLIYLLPVQPNKYILSKYIYCIINTFIIVIISNIINVIIGILNIGNNTTFGILTVTILFIGFLVVAIVVPITIIVGFNKGRYILGFLAIAPACMAKAFAEIFTGITLSTSYTTIKTIIILSCIIFTIVSYFITVSLYSKKEIE